MQYFLCYFEEFCARLNKEGGLIKKEEGTLIFEFVK